MDSDEEPARGTLGEYIASARQACELSQRKLAALAGISNVYLSRLENGERAEPSAEVLQRIADALSIDSSELLAYIGVTPGLPEPRAYFRRKLGVNAEEADVLAQLIEDFQVKRTGGNHEDTN